MRLLLYLAILILGALVGYKQLGSSKVDCNLSKIQSISLLFLLFVMGVKMGLDDRVISSFLELGFQAIIISAFSIFFSVLLVKSVKGYITKDSKKGRQKNDS
ncbi:lysine exporter LysO family protein [Caloranaerobacter azorensis]|uniref:Lysine exporter LysO family protein n=1 Tax=Caloranaerobacter azorensis TaxID=116090 RepID=A0A6P1YGE0_9FIRM|nr:lysine exporter LysO family protein [Caloranaerobacter azorensis]